MVRLDPKQEDVRAADRTIVAVAAASGGKYNIDLHLRHDANATQDFAEAHVRRLEAIRRATGKLERHPSGTWTIAPDHLDTVLAYEQGSSAPSIIASKCSRRCQSRSWCMRMPRPGSTTNSLRLRRATWRRPDTVARCARH